MERFVNVTAFRVRRGAVISMALAEPVLTGYGPRTEVSGIPPSDIGGGVVDVSAAATGPPPQSPDSTTNYQRKNTGRRKEGAE